MAGRFTEVTEGGGKDAGKGHEAQGPCYVARAVGVLRPGKDERYHRAKSANV